ncbi:MAG: hypothetical protein AAGC60_00735 [Acidobacteriota bacterium]
MSATSSIRVPHAKTRRAIAAGLIALCAVTAATVSAQTDPETGAAADPVLVHYDFESAHPSGPDTFWVYARGDLRVDLSSAFRVGGQRSLRITDVAGDGNFAEFLAYLPRRADGLLFWQFYVLFTDVDATHDFGATGERWFLNFERHGHSFWLQVRDGRLRHRTADGWVDLVEVTPFTWYFVDWLYDIDRGIYDLALFAEGLETPLIDVRGVANPTGTRGSAVRFLSFIGDLDDATAPSYFVDEVLAAADPALRLEPFTAPGRRSLFVDSLRRTPPAATERPAPSLEQRALEAADLVATAPAETLDAAQLHMLEATADRLVDVGELDAAEAIYQHLRGHRSTAVVALLKLSDVFFLRGDADGERRAREAIYGRLGEE